MSSANRDEAFIPTYDIQCNTGPCLIKARRVNGVVVGIESNYDFQGKVAAKPCLKAVGLVHKLYNPNRIKNPMKRTNPKKGRNEDPGWVDITWEEALGTVAEKLKEIRQKGLTDNGYPRLAFSTGADGIPRATYGTLEAFLEAWGPVDRELRGGSVKCLHDEHVLGEFWHKAFMNCGDTPRCNWVLSCGSNTNASAGAPAFKRHGEARIRGMKIIQVEPHLSVTGATATEWIPIKPKTDAAFLFALIHVLLHELDWRKSCDLTFLKEMSNCTYLVRPDGYFARDPATNKPLVWDLKQNKPLTYDAGERENLALEGTFNVGGVEVHPSFELLRKHVAGFTPTWAAGITGIPEETIRRLGREFAENAMIGAEVVIDGVRMPFRPVAIVTGKSVNNGVGGYECVWAQHTLEVLVGALEVAGGMLGQQVVINPTPITDDGDGFISHPIFPTDPEKWMWPPRSRDAWNILMPLIAREPGASGPYGPCHMTWYMLKNQPKELPPMSPPEVWMTYRTNPVVSMWDTETVIAGVQRIPFQASFAYELDETNHFADILLPENIDLESLFMYPVGGEKQWESFWEYTGFAIRQPVVKPLHNTRDLTDIFTDLAERVGILPAYNKAMNEGCGVNGIRLKTATYDYSLEPSRKYTREEIYDSALKAATKWLTDGKEEHGLDWYKEHGAFIIPFSKIDGMTKGNSYRRPWYLHPTMKRKGLRYGLPYQERVKRVGEELGQRLHEKGIHWWDSQVAEYQALPPWQDFPAAYDTGPEYDLWMISCRSMQYSLGANASIPLMFEAASNVLGHTGAMINSKTALARGIKHGDLIWIESPLGRIKTHAIVREGVHPEVVATTQQFNHWKINFAKDLGWPCVNALTPITFKTTNGSGSSTDQVKVKVYKA